MLHKLGVHVQDVARQRSVKFTLYRLLSIVGRHATLPRFVAAYTYNFSTENRLRPYMTANGGCFVDVGAKYGLWTLRLAKQGAYVHAFEPNPQSLQRLTANVEALPNVHVYPCALGASESTGTLLLHRSPGHDGLVRPNHDYTGRSLSVPIKPLDSFALDRVGLMKVDTQGYELPVLEGARETLLRDKPRLIIEVHAPQHQQIRVITRFLHGVGYRVKRVGTRQYHLIGDAA